MTDKKISDQWETFLNPDVVRPSLFMATMFITAFEILKDTIIDKIRDFYIIGVDENSINVSHNYKSEVLSRNKSPLYASLQWLQENDAINNEDLRVFEQLKKLGICSPISYLQLLLVK